MGSITDYFEQKINGHVYCGEAWTPPTTYHAALFTTAPSETGGGTEASAGAYARQACTFTKSGSTSANLADIEFPVSTSDHGTIVAVGLFDAATGGNLCNFDIISPTRTYNTGEAITIPAGDYVNNVD